MAGQPGMDMGGLAALAGSPEADPMADQSMAPVELAPGEEDPAMDDKMMLLDDFRNSQPQDAVAAFDALLSAFNVKRS